MCRGTSRGLSHIAFIGNIMLALLLLSILLYLFGGVLGDKLNDYAERLINVNEEQIYVKDCILLDSDADDFEKDSVNNFVVDIGDVNVKDIKLLGLFFDWQQLADGAYIKEWMATCHDGPDLFDSPWETGEVKSDAAIQFSESNAYRTEVECDNQIDVSITISDRFMAGTDAKVYLCYKAER